MGPRAGNTIRSPIAQVLCAEEMAKRLGITRAELATHGIRILSAGTTAQAGASLDHHASHLLAEWNLDHPFHEAHNLTADEAKQAESIWCMGQSQVDAVKAQFPDAGHKVWLLDPQGEIENPHGKPAEVFHRIALHIREAVHSRISEITPLLVPVVFPGAGRKNQPVSNIQEEKRG